MKKLSLSGLKVAVSVLAGGLALFVAQSSASASLFWHLHQPRIPESLLKDEE